MFRRHMILPLHVWIVIEGGNPFYPHADAYCEICGKIRWRKKVVEDQSE